MAIITLSISVPLSIVLHFVTREALFYALKQRAMHRGYKVEGLYSKKLARAGKWTNNDDHQFGDADEEKAAPEPAPEAAPAVVQNPGGTLFTTSLITGRAVPKPADKPDVEARAPAAATSMDAAAEGSVKIADGASAGYNFGAVDRAKTRGAAEERGRRIIGNGNACGLRSQRDAAHKLRSPRKANADGNKLHLTPERHGNARAQMLANARARIPGAPAAAEAPAPAAPAAAEDAALSNGHMVQTA
jgi:hypothetical protein